MTTSHDRIETVENSIRDMKAKTSDMNWATRLSLAQVEATLAVAEATRELTAALADCKPGKRDPSAAAAKQHPSGTPLQHNYTPLEAAEYLRVSRRELYRRIARGDIAHLVMPGSRRIIIPESALAAYLSTTEVGR